MSYKRTPLNIGLFVSDQQDTEETARVAKASAELAHSLKRCRVLLDDCRSKLAANSNEPADSDPGRGRELG
jgi:hypothetical protein